MTIRLGLAGTGRIGASHAETLKALPGVASVVVADADLERARTTATKLGVEFAPDIETLLDSDIAGLIVTTATDSHPELITRAVDRGIPVFCEKPVAADIAGTLEVIRRVGSSTVPVQIGFQRRFDAGYQAARRAVSSGELGWLHTLRATTLDPTPPPAEYIARSGGLFRDCGVHDFDIIRWVSGREITEVFALGANRGERFFVDAGDVDTATVVMRLDDGALATVSLGRYNRAGYDVRLEVLGSEGNAIVGLDDRAPLRSVEPEYPASPYPAYPGFMERFRSAYTEELAVFLSVIAGKVDNPCTPTDALEAFYIAEACELSRREHRPVSVEEVRV
ncbi:Gfo/Idh/MocA family protein [Nocardia pseudobrasiliensis]|uniref:Myo-inositol 2-dehydrogenase/D-chiro-inositol 1-dehydrogenase n=1 Tax=Nocardia pseudobrasiliensis TaxID=45979 RepID=A0A370IF78_9NOCA|nr:Gfo/Idh/MocA family oxidoreductase [Nocardia pseudobrasiliensis]RDI69362.1 myo-inositol 2-dehydrogenase/D-chiro-inositol 1-dehydrogenase [Nocardia pseudobrasiliensis]